MLRASADRLLAATGRELRKQTSSRLRRRARGGRPGYVTTTVRRVPVTARVEPRLFLGRHQAAFVAEVVALLEQESIGHWWLPGAAATPVLGVRVEDRDAVLAALARRAAPSWYVDPLDATGTARHAYLGTSAPRVPPPGVLAWEYAVPAAGSRFVADEGQGLRIWFWSTGPDGALTSLVANLVANELPVDAVADAVARPVADDRVPEPLRPRRTSTVGFPVDVVYTWVDGMDDRWLLDKARAAGVADPALFTERAHDESRFADHDELRHSLRSLEQFAPWVNHVWVVTAGQHPAWLAPDDPWVTVVPHDAVWPDGDGLPTFNSHAIETCLHRIPGLAEHFLYLNDDMLLGRPLTPERVLPPGRHQQVLLVARPGRPRTRRHRRGRLDHRGQERPRAARGALRGDVLAEVLPHRGGAHGERADRARGDVHRGRPRDAARPVPDRARRRHGRLVLPQLGVRRRVGAVPSRLRYTYIDPAAPDAAARLRTLARNRVFDAFCVNDGSSEETPEQRRATDRLIRDFLAAYLPVPGVVRGHGLSRPAPSSTGTSPPRAVPDPAPRPLRTGKVYRSPGGAGVRVG